MQSLYRLCLRAYPAAFRQRHAAEMLRIFEADWRAARHAGLRATLTYLAHVFSDLARTVPHEHFGATTHDGWLAFGTATFCGLTATWIDFLGHDPLATMVIFFVGTVFFSFFAEIRTWRWPVTVAAWLPASYLMAGLVSEEMRDRIGSGWQMLWPLLAMFGWCLTISFAGTGVGVLLRRVFPIRFVCGARSPKAE